MLVSNIDPKKKNHLLDKYLVAKNQKTFIINRLQGFLVPAMIALSNQITPD